MDTGKSSVRCMTGWENRINVFSACFYKNSFFVSNKGDENKVIIQIHCGKMDIVN